MHNVLHPRFRAAAAAAAGFQTGEIMSILSSPLSSSCRAPAFEDAPVFTPNVDFRPHPRLSKDIFAVTEPSLPVSGTKLPLGASFEDGLFETVSVYGKINRDFPWKKPTRTLVKPGINRVAL